MSAATFTKKTAIHCEYLGQSVLLDVETRTADTDEDPPRLVLGDELSDFKPLKSRKNNETFYYEIDDKLDDGRSIFYRATRYEQRVVLSGPGTDALFLMLSEMATKGVLLEGTHYNVYSGNRLRLHTKAVAEALTMYTAGDGSVPIRGLDLKRMFEAERFPGHYVLSTGSRARVGGSALASCIEIDLKRVEDTLKVVAPFSVANIRSYGGKRSGAGRKPIAAKPVTPFTGLRVVGGTEA